MLKIQVTNKIIYSMVFSLVLIVLAGCSAGEKVQSMWNTSGIKIDGDISDWENNLHPVKDEGVSIGFKNDDKYMYLCLVTNNRQKVMQMMMAGFITWITPDNDKSNSFGIKYPMPPSLLDKNQRENFNKELYERDKNRNFITGMIANKRELQIINRDNFPLGQFSINGDNGIKAKLSYDDERFVYELRIPFTGSSDNQYSNQISVKPGGKVEVQFQTVEFDAEGMRGLQGMRPAGETADNRPMGGGMRDDRSSERQFRRPEPFNYTVEVTLDSGKK